MITFLRGIFALDRLLRRVPSVIEVWFLEFLALIPLGMGIAHWLNGLGVGGCPPAPSGVDMTGAGFIAFGLVFAFFAVRRILKPKVAVVEWTPVREVPAGDFIVPVPQAATTVEYAVLSSHPSYAIVNLLTLPLPLVGLLALADRNCGASFFPLFGVVTLALMAALVILRFVSWHGLRLGRAEIERRLPPGVSFAEAEWALAWQPVIAMMALIGACLAVPMAIIGIRLLLGYDI